jgi:hypothetical protein
MLSLQAFALTYSFNKILLCSWFLQAVLATGRGLRRFGPACGALAVGLSRRLVRAVAGRGPRRYREADHPDPIDAEEVEMEELPPRHQALLDLWGGSAMPLQVEAGAEARRAGDSADQVCKSFILFNNSLA